jgi:signal peptidase I
VRQHQGAKRRTAIAIAGAVLCTLLILRHYFSLALALGNSMLPTVSNGELLLISHRTYSEGKPRRGDIVLARLDKELVVKRVIGLPGEEVEVKHGSLYINGALVPETYTLTNNVQFDIAKGKLFANRFATLGDNRGIPAIQTFHPIISKEQIVGKVILSVNILKLQFKYVA